MNSLRQLEIQGIYRPNATQTLNTMAQWKFKVVRDKVQFEAENEKLIREIEAKNLTQEQKQLQKTEAMHKWKKRKH